MQEQVSEKVSDIRADFMSSLVAAFSASFVSLFLCLYKQQSFCLSDSLVVLVAAFASTFFALAAATKVRRTVFKRSALRFLERSVSVVILLAVFSIMYFGDLWEPAGTYYYYERYYDQSMIEAAYAYAFVFDLYAFSGVLLLITAFVGSLLKYDLKALYESGDVYIINWFSMKIVFLLFAIPSIYNIGW